MSKNYKIGSKFRVTSNSTNGFNVGEIVNLVARRVDGLFEMDNGEFQQALYEDQFELVCEPLSQKLKPAKQALADAIHQNGGWGVERFMYATSNYVGMVKMFVNKPKLENANWNADGTQIGFAWLSRPLPNWYQCVLSRDEYFTAYPEQVKVEIRNESERKVDVEMKSESEMTINASDWHKNGELPPVGEVCLYVVSDRCSAEVEITAHAKFGLCFVEIGKSGECYVSKTAELHRFRPIRTEREKAIDEMVGEFINYYGDPKGGERYLGIAEKLYDAGYRNEVK